MKIFPNFFRGKNNDYRKRSENFLKTLPDEILALHSIFYHTQGNLYGLNKDYVDLMLGKQVRKLFKTLNQRFLIHLKHPNYVYKYILSNYCPDAITLRIDYESQIDYLISMSYVLETMRFLKKPILFYCDVDRNYINNYFRNMLVRRKMKIDIDNLRSIVPNKDFYETVYKTVLNKAINGGEERRIIIRDGREEDRIPIDEFGNYLPFFNYYLDILSTSSRIKIIGVINFLKTVYTV